KGDTIDGLMKRYGVPAAAIAEANNIPNGTALRPGQKLVIPKYEATGSTTPRTGAIAAPATSTSQHVHIVAPGETLMALSRKYQKPLAELAKANKIEPHTLVKVGDRIVIPGVRATQAAVKPPATVTQQPTVAQQQKPAA